MPKRKCRQCGEYFPRDSMIITPSNAAFCGPDCASMYAVNKSMTDAEKKARQKKTEFARDFKSNDRRHQLKLAQANFNKFIRLRDEKEPCISCQRYHDGQYHAGHYRTRKAMPELAFEEMNCHKQCSACNNYLSGNITEYRMHLIKKIGLINVEWLEGPHQNRKKSIEEIITLKKYYSAKCRELEKRGGNQQSKRRVRC